MSPARRDGPDPHWDRGGGTDCRLVRRGRIIRAEFARHDGTIGGCNGFLDIDDSGRAAARRDDGLDHDDVGCTGARFDHYDRPALYDCPQLDHGPRKCRIPG